MKAFERCCVKVMSESCESETGVERCVSEGKSGRVSEEEEIKGEERVEIESVEGMRAM